MSEDAENPEAEFMNVLYTFVEFFGNNLERSQTLGFRIHCLTLQTSFKPLLLTGEGGVKSVIRGDCE